MPATQKPTNPSANLDNLPADAGTLYHCPVCGTDCDDDFESVCRALDELAGNAEPTPADILRGAALYIERHGHHKGDFFAPDETTTSEAFPRACAMGAIRIAITGDANTNGPFYPPLTFMQAAYLLAEYLNLPLVEDANSPYELIDDTEVYMGPLGDWNDDQARTADEVIEALRSAADEYDSETDAQSELDNDRIPTRDGFALWKLRTTAASSDGSQPAVDAEDTSTDPDDNDEES